MPPNRTKQYPKVGDMVAITPAWKKNGRTQALRAWKHKDLGQNFFYQHEPQDSNNYQEWFENLIESTGYVVAIDKEWTKVHFFCFDHPLWFRDHCLKTIQIK